MDKAEFLVMILVCFLAGVGVKDSYKEILQFENTNTVNESISGITELVCSEVSQSDIDHIGELTNLHKLEVVIHEEVDLDLSFIKNFEELEKLSIVKSEVESMDFIQDLSKIEELQISYIGDTDISALTKLTELRTLYLVGDNMRNFECLHTMKDLKSVFLLETSPVYEGRKIINLNVFENLNKLSSLDMQNLDLVNIESISQLPVLETVILVNTEIDNIQCLTNLENLKRLEIYGYSNNQVVDQISYFSQVEKLVITDAIPAKFNN